MTILARGQFDGLIIFLVVLGVAAVIAIVSFLIYKFLHLKIKADKTVNEEEALEEELNRILEPVEDEKVAKEIADYLDEEDE